MELSEKGVQKNTEETRDEGTSNSNSASSSSASAMSQSSHVENDSRENKNINKIEGETPSKKINRGESSNSPEEVETESDPGQATSTEDAPINNLPPEMLTLILKFVDSRSLLKCRLVSRQWSEISTGILRNREPLIANWFRWEKDTFRHKGRLFVQKNVTSLKDFVQCAKNSTPKNCPFTHFWFSIEDSACFDDKDFRDFLSVFSTRRLKRVRLEAIYRTMQFSIFVEKLRHFLLNDVPQLEGLHLELISDSEGVVDHTQVPLFPITANTNSDGPPLPGPLPVQFQLPNLKLLDLGQGRFRTTISSHPRICKDLLNAAVNLTRIKTRVHSPEDFEFFMSLGKLHLLKEVVLCFNDDFVMDMKKEEFQLQFKNWSQSENFFPRVRLEKLEISSIHVSKFEEASLIQASKLVSALLESSKDSLRDLKICVLPFLAHLQLPVFTRLRKLEIYADEPHQLFPRETRTRNIFPAVDSLEFYVHTWSQTFPHQDSVPRLPGVKTLILKEWSFKPEQADIAMFTLARLCPNYKNLVLQKSAEPFKPPKLNFVEVGRSIWTHMKELESLELDVDLDKPENNSLALDSCFTGISQETCIHLLKLTQAKQFLEENGIPVEIPESKLKAEREHPSILEMKHLRNLTINPYLRTILLDKKEFSNKLTWISHELAFKLMPNLKFNEGGF